MKKRRWFCLVMVMTMLVSCSKEKDKVILGEEQKMQEDEDRSGEYTSDDKGDFDQGTDEKAADDGRRQTEKDVDDKSGQTEHTAASEKKGDICVFVCGAVNTPGVYYLSAGARVYEAVEAAGGFSQDADTQWLNQAASLKDGCRIWIYTREESRAMEEAGESPDEGDISFRGTGENTEDSGKININTASLEELQSIPGIGEKKAQAILSYRQEKGSFGSCEEIQQVPGIKGGTFEKIKDYITTG